MLQRRRQEGGPGDPTDQIMGTVPGCLIPRLDTASAGYLTGGTSNCAIAEARMGRLSDHDRFWLIPVICTVLVFGLGFGLIAFDRVTQYSIQLPFVISSGAEGARAALSAIAGSMITFTGLVFSITIVTLQLTSSQFSPRVLRNFLRDRFSQWRDRTAASALGRAARAGPRARPQPS
jgi:uncharacterized membrane protein